MANTSGKFYHRVWLNAPVVLFVALLGLITSLAVANIVFYTHLRVSLDSANEPIGVWYRMFDMGAEANFPTWVAVSLWLCAAAVAGCYSLLASGTWSWRLLAMACLVLAADEAAQLHEQLNAVGALPGIGGIEHLLVYPWLLPGALIALFLAAAFLRTVLALPRWQRGLILTAGVLFVAGALGVESVGGWALQNSGLGMRYVVITAAEEAIEMTAVALFACSLMSLMVVSRSAGEFSVRRASLDTSAGAGERRTAGAPAAATANTNAGARALSADPSLAA